jgi:hypothetical protein
VPQNEILRRQRHEGRHRCAVVASNTRERRSARPVQTRGGAAHAGVVTSVCPAQLISKKVKAQKRIAGVTVPQAANAPSPRLQVVL